MRALVWIVTAMILMPPMAHAESAFMIDDYNASLAKFGMPFFSRYPATFYTGFAMRVEEPKRLHFRAGRGNQVRLTAILDEYTVLTYLYTLQKRSRVIRKRNARACSAPNRPHN